MKLRLSFSMLAIYSVLVIGCSGGATEEQATATGPMPEAEKAAPVGSPTDNITPPEGEGSKDMSGGRVGR